MNKPLVVGVLFALGLLFCVTGVPEVGGFLLIGAIIPAWTSLLDLLTAQLTPVVRHRESSIQVVPAKHVLEATEFTRYFPDGTILQARQIRWWQ